jgi:hypothetical protein
MLPRNRSHKTAVLLKKRKMVYGARRSGREGDIKGSSGEQERKGKLCRRLG